MYTSIINYRLSVREDLFVKYVINDMSSPSKPHWRKRKKRILIKSYLKVVCYAPTHHFNPDPA